MVMLLVSTWWLVVASLSPSSSSMFLLGVQASSPPSASSLLLLSPHNAATSSSSSSSSSSHFLDQEEEVQRDDLSPVKDWNAITRMSSSSLLQQQERAPNCTTAHDKQQNRLECWLWNDLTVEIPPQSFSEHYVTIQIHDMECTNFQLQQVWSQYDGEAPGKLPIHIHQVAATCHGQYHASGGLSGNVQASVGAAASSEHPAIKVMFEIQSSSSSQGKSPVIIPQSFQTISCQTDLQAQGIDFSGSISAKMIGMFRKTIGKYITEALQEYLCPLLQEKLDPLVNLYLQQLDEWIQPYLPPSILLLLSSQKNLMSSTTTSSTTTQSKAPTKREPTETVSAVATTTTTRRRLAFIEQGNNNNNYDDDGTEKNNYTTNTTTSSLADWPVIRSILELVNDQLANHLNQGWLLHPEDIPNLSPSCAHLFGGWSGWMKSIFGSSIQIPLPQQSFPLPPLPLDAHGMLNLSHVAIHGLFDDLDVLQLLSPNNNNNNDSVLLFSTVETQRGFDLLLPMSLKIQLPNKNKHKKPALMEDFDLMVNMTQVQTIINTLIQIHDTDWEQTSVLQVILAIQFFLDSGNMEHLDCLIHTLHQVKLDEWLTTFMVDSIRITRRRQSPQTTTDGNESSTTMLYSLEDDLDQVINHVLQLVTTEYQDLITLVSKGLIQGPIRHAMNQLFHDWISRVGNKTCPAIPVTTQPVWLNFTRLSFLRDMNALLNQTSTRDTMNHYMTCLGNVWEGLVQMNTTTTTNNRSSSSVSTVTNKEESSSTLLKLRQIFTDHWNGVKSVELFKPVDETSVVSSVLWGIDDDATPELTAMVDVTSALLNGTVNITLFTGFQARLGTQLDYNLNTLQNITVANVLRQGECFVLPTAELRFLPNTYWNLGRHVGLNLSGMINDKYHVAFSSLDHDGKPELFTNSIMEWALDWSRNILNQGLEAWTVGSRHVCTDVVLPTPSPPDPNNNHNDHSSQMPWYKYPLVWVAGILLLLSQVVFVVYVAKPPLNIAILVQDDEEEEDHLRRPLLSPEHSSSSSLSNNVVMMRELNPNTRTDLRHEHVEEEDNQCILEEHGSGREIGIMNHNAPTGVKPRPFNSLFHTMELQGSVRYAIPMLIVGTIVLLFSSNVSVGASVDLRLRLPGQNHLLRLPALFEFSLGNTITDLFAARIYPLLFLVVVFSGIWPYAKLFWMLYAWIVPYSNVHQREQRLLTLDALSKFSLVDTYVLVVFLVAFRFHLDLAESLGLDVYVTPKYGFYTFLLATCLSLLLGHAILYCHRRAEHAGMITDHSLESIFDHYFDVQDNGPRRRLSRFFQFILFTCCLAAFTFLALGFSKESFTFEFGGLAGVALGEHNQTSYSLLSLGAAIPRSVEMSNSFAVRLLQVAYYFYAVLTPMSCLGFLMILLVQPMSLQTQRYLLVAAEISNAWSAVEVFVLSIIAALFQISTFAAFIIGDKCDLINQLAGDIMGDIIPTDADDMVCFTVKASVEPNGWYLVVGVLLNSFVVSIGLRLAHLAMDSRMIVSSQLQQQQEECPVPDTTNDLVHRIYNLPLGSILFGPGVPMTDVPQHSDDEVDDDEEDEEEEELPEWRNWF